MIVIGELLNTSLKRAREAVASRDTERVKQLARRQAEAGANFIDVNAGTNVENETGDLVWLIETVQEAVDLPLCIDTANPAALGAALAAAKAHRPLVNSITGEKERFEAVLRLVEEHNTMLVALTLDDSGMPKTAEARIEVGTRLVERILETGLAHEDLFVDPLVQPVGVNPEQGVHVLKTIRAMKEQFPEIHVICGLSNISFGLPQRKLLNQCFLPMAVAAGLDAVIVNPLDDRMIKHIYASEALTGRDEWCMNYLSASRSGLLTD